MAPAPTRTAHVDPRVLRSRNDILSGTLQILLDEGWDSVTHARVAQLTGYSKATVYKHWPTRSDLVLNAFDRLRDLPHHHPTGDLAHDLVEEIKMFRSGITELGLDRALCILVELARSSVEFRDVRERLVTDGEYLIRSLLAPSLAGDDLEAATLMLVGAVLHGALMHGQPPNDKIIAASVNLVLRAAGPADGRRAPSGEARRGRRQ